ncbi:MAG: tRNA (adenosine(37)-N6)-threonylcarbamoyltransferase complex transferase subunit TsaD [Clostridiales bacterium]|nr:tRNA (adenosine(37)-N6)-threonylcarbamoyltransferase complex transferase subunit TsaD [Clostridiales bacterium]
MKDVLILGIESSCDETAVSVVKNGREILSDVIISSCNQHVKFGGVVPEIASRAHATAIDTAYTQALQTAGVSIDDIDAVAVTFGAGLLGALLVGVSFAKAIAYAYHKPLIPVNHIRGHVAAGYLNSDLKPPFITLLTSGGHTAVVQVDSYTHLKVLGSTRDDAVGEAFDKVARVLGIPYPGGPGVERAAREGRPIVPMPQMLKGDKSYDFSYSGLKTAVVNYCHTKTQSGEGFSVPDVAASFQTAALSVLVDKAFRAVKETGYSVLSLGGGVAANGHLRALCETRAKKEGITLYMPEKKLCTDNGAMIAAEGYLQYLYTDNRGDLTLNAAANIPEFIKEYQQ